MRDPYLDDVRSWIEDGFAVAVATIVDIEGSSSKPLASRMFVRADGLFVGSVSGGCVEGDIVERAERVLYTGTPELLRYERVTDPVFQVGLNCEGSIRVFLEPLTAELRRALMYDPPYVHRTRIGASPERVSHHIKELRGTRIGSDDQPVSRTFDDGSIELAEPVLPAPTLLVFGATDVACELSYFARRLGFRVVVADPRSNYAKADAHPYAHSILTQWPEEVFRQHPPGPRSYVVSLNHETRFEDALFRALLDAGAQPAYVGALGKRERHLERLERSQEAGFDLSQLPPVHTPVGLDIGGKSPAEIAVSIVAEIVAVRNSRNGGMHLARFVQNQSN